MSNLIRTTITIPEDLMEWTKIVAARWNTSVSAIIQHGIDELRKEPSLLKEVKVRKKPGSILSKLAGSFDLGGREPYIKRSDLYEEHIRRKISG